MRYRSDIAVRLYCDLYTTSILIYIYKYTSRITYFDDEGKHGIRGFIEWTVDVPLSYINTSKLNYFHLWDVAIAMSQ